MLMIRLSRVGKKHHPLYRVVVSEKKKDTKGDYLELLGTYDPHANTTELKEDRIKHWISNGAQPSGTVHNLLVDKGIISGEKLKVANIKKKKATEESEAAGDQSAKPETSAEAKPDAAAEKKEAAPADEKAEEKTAEPAPADEKK